VRRKKSRKDRHESNGSGYNISFKKKIAVRGYNYPSHGEFLSIYKCFNNRLRAHGFGQRDGPGVKIHVGRFVGKLY
jgi:hypothetical protein